MKTVLLKGRNVGATFAVLTALRFRVAQTRADFRTNPCSPSLVVLRVAVKTARQAGLKAEFPNGFIEDVIRSVPRYRGLDTTVVLAKAPIPQN